MLVQTTLTVFFDGTFWKALVERREGSALSIAVHIFGAEPTGAEVYDWWLRSDTELGFTSRVAAPGRPKDPGTGRKRSARQAAKALRNHPITEEIREAVRAERQRRRALHQKEKKEMNLVAREQRRAIRAYKAKQKHRGR